jgi:hypothetical protein
MLAIFMTGCTNNSVSGPYSLQEALDAQLPLPVYESSESVIGYSLLKTVYYYFDLGSELRLDTYFVTSDGDKVIRVARMSLYTANGQLIATDEAGNKTISIDWAQGNKGGNCKVLPSVMVNEYVSGEDYQSCLFWFDQELRQYKLYTVWTEDEAVTFANSLSRVEH